MKPVRWSLHSIMNLAEREIDKADADQTLLEPEFVVQSPPTRWVYMRRFWDSILQQDMLLRVIVEETESEFVVVTVYKTSQIGKYLKGRS